MWLLDVLLVQATIVHVNGVRVTTVANNPQVAVFYETKVREQIGGGYVLPIQFLFVSQIRDIEGGVVKSTYEYRIV